MSSGATDPSEPSGEPVRLGLTRADKGVLVAVGLVAGGLVAWGGPALVGWLVGVDFPVPAWLRWIMTAEVSWLSWTRPLAALGAGTGLAAALISRSPVVRVTRETIVVERGTDSRKIARADVASVYREDGKVVVETAAGRRLFAGEVEGGREKVRQTFLERGWPYESE